MLGLASLIVLSQMMAETQERYVLRLTGPSFGLLYTEIAGKVKANEVVVRYDGRYGTLSSGKKPDDWLVWSADTNRVGMRFPMSGPDSVGLGLVAVHTNVPAFVDVVLDVVSGLALQNPSRPVVKIRLGSWREVLCGKGNSQYMLTSDSQSSTIVFLIEAGDAGDETDLFFGVTNISAYRNDVFGGMIFSIDIERLPISEETLIPQFGISDLEPTNSYWLVVPRIRK